MNACRKAKAFSSVGPGQPGGHDGPDAEPLHDGRLLTLDDTVEFFNLVTELKLTDEEKKALVAFMRCL